MEPRFWPCIVEEGVSCAKKPDSGRCSGDISSCGYACHGRLASVDSPVPDELGPIPVSLHGVGGFIG